MQDALDEQIRAEEGGAGLRAELENARAELAEVRAANPAGGNAGISSASSPAGDGYGAGYSQSGGISADEAAAMEVERYQLVAELQAKSRKLEEAKAEAGRDAADAANALKTQEMEAAGKKVSGGLHKFDASEVDVHGGSGTADDFMDAFGF